MASSLTVEKVDRPELAKHDSSILGKVDIVSSIYTIVINII